ncbi:type IA DNA topoisomerase [Chryseobacterium oncorhynchi]|uniref:DNA topoisomerase n=1 Tax=Chryseobacterium oncorhynchi TaxID=741074 RepID=A0A316WFZ2_9FLAO|nr:type IA DNA topoisomerase [Chryseobacterium oncorhynchi]PWN60039.1 type IA DNA topoisomerase [Chryseobacterium oncorhynchi]
MKKLIIAEKPSQAKEYAQALGGFDNKNGYYESNQYYLTWCYGHLIELERDEAYHNEKKWNKSYLPLIPTKYLYKIGSSPSNSKNIDSGKKKQLDIIRSLLSKSKEIINATDADREGELIFLYVYNFLGSKLPYKRLWISSLTEGDIRTGFNNLLDSKEVFYLGKSAYARAIADWLVGVNGTQAATLQLGNGSVLTIGRVQTAILKIICERFLKNKSFQKTFTYRLRAEHNENVFFHSETEIFDHKIDAENTIKSCSAFHKCVDIIKQNQKVNPPLLFSIDTLIIEANKKFKYSGKETLDIAQTLYEKKLTSYPRTDSEYINQENYNRQKEFIVSFAKALLGYSFSFSNNIPRSVNDTKLTGSHDAIVLTGQKENIQSLNAKEKNVYLLILNRCLQSFSDAAVYEKTKYVFDNNSVMFYTYSSKVLFKGWQVYQVNTEQNEKEDDVDLQQNEQQIDIVLEINRNVKVESLVIKEIESKPPQLYSEVNLTKDLTNFGKLLKEQNPELVTQISSSIDLNLLQIGTQATRPGIIEKLKKIGFIDLHKNKYVPTEKGLKFYSIIKDLEVSNIVTTAIWESKLKKVAEGKEDIGVFYKEITEFTKKIVVDIFSNSTDVSFSKEINSLGTCPICKDGLIIEFTKSYGCSNWNKDNFKCKFSIWKIIYGKKITTNIVSQLIKNGITKKIDNLKSSKGTSFSAKLKLSKDGKITPEF